MPEPDFKQGFPGSFTPCVYVIPLLPSFSLTAVCNNKLALAVDAESTRELDLNSFKS